MITGTVETRIPDAGWVKSVTGVAPRAKTGYDWQGEFLKPGVLEDLAPGFLLVDASEVGSRKHPVKDVDLRVLLPDGSWMSVEKVRSNDWAVDMRHTARQFLEMAAEKRIAKAAAIGLERWNRILAEREEMQQSIRDAWIRIQADFAETFLKDGYSAVVAVPQWGSSYYRRIPLRVAGREDSIELARADVQRAVDEELEKGETRLADARAKVEYLIALCDKTKRHDALVVPQLAELEPAMQQALAELVAACGSQQRAAEVLADDSVRRAVRKVLRPPKPKPAAAVEEAPAPVEEQNGKTSE